MARNQLKSFPTAMLRRGLAHIHPASSGTAQRSIDPPGNQPLQLDLFVPSRPPSVLPWHPIGDGARATEASSLA